MRKHSQKLTKKQKIVPLKKKKKKQRQTFSVTKKSRNGHSLSHLSLIRHCEDKERLRSSLYKSVSKQEKVTKNYVTAFHFLQIRCAQDRETIQLERSREVVLAGIQHMEENRKVFFLQFLVCPTPKRRSFGLVLFENEMVSVLDF